MKIGVLDFAIDLSVQNYGSSLQRELERLGAVLVPFGPKDPLPEGVDLYWDPRLTAGTPPWHTLLQAPAPVVATIFDVAPLSLAPWECYSSWRQAARGYRGMAERLYAWRRHWRGKCAAIITSSRHSERKLRRLLGLRSERIRVIPLGVDTDLFRPPATRADSGPLLHVSQYHKNKNVERIVRAYRRLKTPSKPPLVLVLTYYRGPGFGPGVELHEGPVPLAQLIEHFQGAHAFVFPSLHEGFGLPIIEAMACGCPVITSDRTACPETAGGAAELVNPRSVDQLIAAMETLLEDPERHHELRGKGLAWARELSWEQCARRHLEVFEEALRHGRPPGHT